MFEKVVAFVVYKDKCREVFYLYLPDCFHSELRKLEAFYIFNVVLGEYCRRSSDRAEVEAAIFMAGVGYLLAAVALCYYYHTAALVLE